MRSSRQVTQIATRVSRSGLATELARPGLAEDERFRRNAARSANRAALTEILGALLAERVLLVETRRR